MSYNQYDDRKRRDERTYKEVEKKQKINESESMPTIHKSQTSDKLDLTSSKFDVFSTDFDPLLALYSLTELPKGLPKVKPMESIQRCRFILPSGSNLINYF
jgi:hypothetical protein